jgi:hypothetical protein
LKITDKIIKSESIHWQEMKFLQPPGFKDLTKDAYNKLRQSIINNHFVESFKVWQDKKIIYCLDGFHRVKVLKELKKEGHEIPDVFRADFLGCKDKKEASKLVLIYSSIYAAVTQEGLYEFTNLQDLDITSFKEEIDIPGFDINTYLKGYEEKETLEYKEEEIKPYKKTHILLSFPPEKFLDIQPYIDKILKIEGVEYEQSSN